MVSVSVRYTLHVLCLVGQPKTWCLSLCANADGGSFNEANRLPVIFSGGSNSRQCTVRTFQCLCNPSVRSCFTPRASVRAPSLICDKPGMPGLTLAPQHYVSRLVSVHGSLSVQAPHAPVVLRMTHEHLERWACICVLTARGKRPLYHMSISRGWE